MAGAITQRISLESDVAAKLTELVRAGQDAFGKIARAAEDSGSRFKKLEDGLAAVDAKIKQLGSTKITVGAGLDDATAALAKTRQELDATGKTLQSAATASKTGIASATGSVTKFVLVLGTLTAAATAAGAALFGMAKSAADSVTELDKAAGKLGVSINAYQQAQFALRQLGLTSKETEQALTKFGEASKTAGDVGAEAIAKFGLRFPKTVEGAKSAAEFAGRLFNIMHDGKRQVDDATAALLLGNAALKQFGEGPEAAVEALGAFADAVSKIRDPEKQTEVATKVLGDALGNKLLESLKKGGDGVRGFVDDFKLLRLGVSEEGVAAANAFTESLKKLDAEFARFQIAREAGQRELGLSIAPTIKPVVDAAAEALHNFTTAIRTGGGAFSGFQETVKGIASSFRDFAIPAIRGFFSLLQGQEAGVPPWMIRLRDGILDIGSTFKTVFTDIIVPAVKSLGVIATTVAQQVNNLFGTKLSAVGVGVVAVLAAIVGGFNALGIAALAVIPLIVANFGKFSAALKANGVDISGFVAKIKELFADLKAAITGRDVDVKNSWILDVRDAIKDFATSIPGAIVLAIAAFKGLNLILGVVAAGISRVFGVKIAGGELGLVLFAASASGALTILNGVLATVALTLAVVSGAVKLLGTAISLLLRFPILLAAAFVLLVANIDNVTKALNDFFGTKFTNIDVLITALLGVAAAFVVLGVNAAGASVPVLALLARLAPFLAALTALGLLAKDVTGSGGALGEFERQQDALTKSFQRGEISAEQYATQLRALQEANAGVAKSTETTSSIADQFKSAFDKVSAAIKSTVGGLGTVEGATTKAGETLDSLQKKANEAGKAVSGIVTGVGGTKFNITRLPDSFNKIEDAAGGLADKAKEFGANLLDAEKTAEALARALELPTIDVKTGAQGAIGEFGKIDFDQSQLDPAPVNSFRDAAVAAFNEVSAAAQAMASAISSALQSISAIDVAQGIVSAFQAAAQQIAADFDAAVSGLAAAFDSMASNAASSLDGLIARVQELVSQLQQASQAAASIQLPSGGGGDGSAPFAGGGHVRGKGTWTSDSIPAWLSNGEFVVQAQGVARLMRRYGSGIMSWINRGELPRFNMGGFADRLQRSLSDSFAVPRFAAGGAVNFAPAGAGRALHPVTINFSGQKVTGVLAPTDVVENMRRAAAQALISRGGVKPDWYTS